MSYRGVIIEESLVDRSVLADLSIVATEVEQVTENFGTPWLRQWTLRTVEIPEDRMAEFSERIAGAIDTAHVSSWFADFSNDQRHYIIFSHKVFVVDKAQPEAYEAARQYGLSLGIPAHQLRGF